MFASPTETPLQGPGGDEDGPEASDCGSDWCWVEVQQTPPEGEGPRHGRPLQTQALCSFCLICDSVVLQTEPPQKTRANNDGSTTRCPGPVFFLDHTAPRQTAETPCRHHGAPENVFPKAFAPRIPSSPDKPAMTKGPVLGSQGETFKPLPPLATINSPRRLLQAALLCSEFSGWSK